MGLNAATIAPSGDLTMTVLRGGLDAYPWPSADTTAAIVAHGLPRAGLPDIVNAWRLRNAPNLWRGWRRILAAKALGVPTYYGALYLTKTDGRTGEVIPYGLGSLRVVTTAGVNKIVALLNTTDATTGVNFKYHGFGTGTTAEAAGDTALVTELTTQYNPDSTRPTGTQTVGASNNIYRTVGTLTPDSGGTIAITEHGVFSATSAGTLLDRSKFTAVNLDSAAGDSLQVTYELTLPAGS